MNWLNSNTGAIQALSSLGMLLVTVVLTGATLAYVYLTNRMLKVSQSNFERHWKPNVGLKLEYVPPYQCMITIHNIGNAGIFVTAILLGVAREESRVARYAVHQPVAAGSKESIEGAKYVLEQVKVPAGRPESVERILVGLEYHGEGVIGMVGYCEYSARVSGGRVVEILPIDTTPRLRSNTTLVS